MALDITKFDDVNIFKNRVDEVIKKIKHLSVDGGPVLCWVKLNTITPKELQNGVPLDEEVVCINELAKKYGASELKA